MGFGTEVALTFAFFSILRENGLELNSQVAFLCERLYLLTPWSRGGGKWSVTACAPGDPRGALGTGRGAVTMVVRAGLEDSE